ncbi:hypothetical protein BK133_03650 [Paenibacillus sp. FSL H8-0548]|uniref:glycoside hydrolase family 172 protein n=1 Tax=Paenibacillus sp. FSL H8-0548 TaxID=1920422 RepID=UPI00096F12F0|nr:glycoside hydrolase family 172 protein [Paenibacillus sp. FSL H8-0548]OMF38081.1 hypothetical protein BK133_03650 [Paenibacillus sp. FSL H8-0548]
MNNLYLRKEGISRRSSSWDTTGGNADNVRIASGKSYTIADITGSGVVQHIWMTISSADIHYFRKILIRMYWDGEVEPSVEVPVGDFFGVGHGVASHYVSLPLNMITTPGIIEDKAAMNCFFEMPFGNGARMEVTNECQKDIIVYYYVDYVEKPVPDDAFRFHAQFRREMPTAGTIDLSRLKEEHDKQDDAFWANNKVNDIKNTDGSENYIIFEAEGEGHYVGCNLSIDNIDPIPGNSWFGEGDDMFFIDGEPWPPRLHGTGTEDYFCAAWCYPSGKYDGPYHGISLAAPLRGNGHSWTEPNIIPTELEYSGKWTTYRFHIVDPILFRKSITFSIEHGHGNSQSNDYSSVAYWYQREPHKTFPMIVPVERRLPLSERASMSGFLKSF